MSYIEKIREMTKQNLDYKKDRELRLALTEIEERAKTGYYSAIFHYYKTEVLDFIAEYLTKEGFSIDKHYKIPSFSFENLIPTDFIPFIRIEWKD